MGTPINARNEKTMVRKKRKKGAGKIRQIYNRIMDKGHQRLTVMFIPHSEKRVVNFQISIFSLIFILSLLTVVIVVGVVSVDLQDRTANELSIKSIYYKESEQELNRFAEEINRLVEPIETLKITMQQVQHALVMQDPFSPDMNAKGGVNIDTLTAGSGNEYEGMSFEHKILENAENTVLEITQKLQELEMAKNSIKDVFNKMPSIYPIQDVKDPARIVSGFGYRTDPFHGKRDFHTGVDIVAFTGTPIKAAAEGTVKYAQYAGGAGLYIELLHRWGFSTRYMHCSSIIVEPGQTIKKGEIIGYVGTTGRSTGPHLHFEVRINNNPVDPKKFIFLDPF